MCYTAIPGQFDHELKLPDGSADADYLESDDFENWVSDETQQLMWGLDADHVTAVELEEVVSSKMEGWLEDDSTGSLAQMLILIAGSPAKYSELYRLLLSFTGTDIKSTGPDLRNNAITELAEDLVRATADKHLLALKDQGVGA